MTLDPDTCTDPELVREASRALKYAYAPYSNFSVGAAVRSRSGRVYRGCNIENASYGLSICAERVALFKAISEGDRNVERLAVVIDSSLQLATPCGACRQVMQEVNRYMMVLRSNTAGHVIDQPLSELLADPFDFGNPDR